MIAGHRLYPAYESLRVRGSSIHITRGSQALAMNLVDHIHGVHFGLGFEFVPARRPVKPSLDVVLCLVHKPTMSSELTPKLSSHFTSFEVLGVSTGASGATLAKLPGDLVVSSLRDVKGLPPALGTKQNGITRSSAQR